jgi:O-antigen ligase
MGYFKLSRFFLYLVPFATIIVTRSTLFPFIVGKYAWFRASVGLALIFFLLGLLLKKDEASEYEKKLLRVIKSPLAIATGLFTLFFFLSGMLGFDPSYSFWSNFERGEGSLQIINLFVFFILTATLFNKAHWIKMFWVAVASALLMVGYGVGAGLGWRSFVGSQFGHEGFRFMGSIGNPAYVAAYLIFSSFYALYIWVEKYRRKIKAKGSIFLGVTIVIFTAAFLSAATRGAFVGLMGGVLVALIYMGFSRKEWRKRTIIIGVAFIIAMVLLVQFRSTPFIQSIPGSRILDISFTATTFQHRLIMWGIAWDSFKERPLLGWGPESFGYLFQRNFDPAYYEPGTPFGAWFDRAHNIFFDYLAEVGILGAGSYAAIFLIFYWKFLWNKKIKNSLSLVQRGAMAAIPITYVIQGLALFDVLVIYINIFMFMAFANWLFTQNESESAD